MEAREEGEWKQVSLKLRRAAYLINPGASFRIVFTSESVHRSGKHVPTVTRKLCNKHHNDTETLKQTIHWQWHRTQQTLQGYSNSATNAIITRNYCNTIFFVIGVWRYFFGDVRFVVGVLRLVFCGFHFAVCVLRLAFCGWLFVVGVLWLAFCGLHFAVCVLRLEFCVLRFTIGILGLAFCGWRFAVGVLQLAFCIIHASACGLLFALCFL